MTRSVFFVHTGPDDIALYAVFQAVSLGFDVHVIGDERWRGRPSVTYHDIEQHRHAAAEFMSFYRHLSVNDETYERFCFERWFMILSVVRPLGLRHFYYADSDLLVYPDAFDPDLENRFEIFDTAWFNFFRDVSALDRLCQFLTGLYRGNTAERLAEKYAIEGRLHLSDMHCLFEYGIQEHQRVAPLSTMGQFLGFDERISNTMLVTASDLCSSLQKVVRRELHLEIQLRISRKVVTVRTLHFQGRSKPFIQAYHNISDQRYVAKLPDLSHWYEANSLLDHPDCAHMAKALIHELSLRATSEIGKSGISFMVHQPMVVMAHLPSANLSTSPGDHLMSNDKNLRQLKELARTLTVHDRDHVLALLKLYDFQGSAAEIGTFNGTFANEILQHTNFSKLICVDPYIAYDDFKDAINVMDMDLIFNQAKSFLLPYGNRVEFIRKFSTEAASDIPDGSLDFVYIDGNHQAKYVFQDLENWWPKIRPGGIIIGDDCADTDDSTRNADGDVTLVHRRAADGTPELYGDYGVLFALRKFAQQHSLEYVVLGSQFFLPKGD